MRLPITDDVVVAVRRGMKKKGWGISELARQIEKDRQLVWNVVNQKSATSEIVIDMLKALDEPLWTALALTDAEKLLMEDLGLDINELPADDQVRLIKKWRRELMGELALRDKKNDT